MLEHSQFQYRPLTLGEQCQLNNFPISIFHHEGAVLNDTLIVCGGLESYGAQKNCFAYDPDTDSWSKVSGDKGTKVVASVYPQKTTYIHWYHGNKQIH